MTNLWSPANVIMAVVLSMLGWLGVSSVAVQKAQAIQKVEQMYDHKINVYVEDLAPRIRQMESDLVDVKCMLRFPSSDTQARLACITHKE